jgi:hypothetical protein
MATKNVVSVRRDIFSTPQLVVPFGTGSAAVTRSAGGTEILDPNARYSRGLGSRPAPFIRAG